MTTFAARPPYAGPMDARTVASLYAQGLAYFCELSRLVTDYLIFLSLDSFSVNLMAVSPNALNLILQNVNTSISSNMPNGLAQALTIFTLAMMAEQFISGYSANAIAYISPHTANQLDIAGSQYEMLDGSTCSCLTSISCRIPAAIYFNSMNPVGNIYVLNENRTLVKGLQTDCYPINGFLASNLECYYDLSCLELLVPNASSFLPLNSSLPSRFSLQTNMQDFLNSFMIENLFFDYFAEILYEKCAPLTCSYSYIRRSTLLTVITFTMGLISGVYGILRYSIPLFVDTLWETKRVLLSSSPREIEANALGKDHVHQKRIKE